MDVIQRIQESYPELSRTQKRIADFLLKNTDRACFLSLRDLSEEVSASEVTIIRFTREIGCENFTDLKSALQQYISSRLSPSEKVATAIDNLQQNGIAQIIQQEQEAIEQTLQLISTSDLKVALTLIKQSKRIYTVGDNVSKIVTDFIRLRLRHLGLDAVEFEMNTFDSMSTQLLHIQKSDIFIIVSFPKYAQRIIPLTEYLHKHGIKMICITDRVTSPIARYATAPFACATYSSVFYNSISAPIALANVFASALAIELKDDYKHSRHLIRETSQFLRQKEEQFQEQLGEPSEPILAE